MYSRHMYKCDIGQYKYTPPGCRCVVCNLSANMSSCHSFRLWDSVLSARSLCANNHHPQTHKILNIKYLVIYMRTYDKTNFFLAALLTH